MAVPAGNFTVEFWQRFDGPTTWTPTTFGLNPIVAGNNFKFHSPWNSGPDYLFWDLGSERHQKTNVNNRTGWHHFALVKNGATTQVYWNGALIINEAQTSSFTPYQADLQLPWGGSVPYNGRIDEFRIWNVARTQAQIQTYWKRNLRGTETGLLAYWDFNEGTGSSANDKTGHGYNGTMASPPVWNVSDVPLLPAITDVSGSTLDGEFGGTFPSGNMFAGGDFTAQFTLSNVPPPAFNITAMTPAPASTQTSTVSSIVFTFSTNLDPATVNTNTLKLKRAGLDGILDTGDDVDITPTAVSVVNGNQIKIDQAGQANPSEKYRITLNATTLPVIKDLNGSTLDGEYPGQSGGFPSGNGTVGGDFTTTFQVDLYSTTTVVSAPQPITYGTTSVALSATVNGGPVQNINTGTVTFQLKNGAAANVGSPVAGNVTSSVANVVYPIPSGTVIGAYSIVGTYSGGGLFTTSFDNSQKLDITKAALSVTPNNFSRAYGSTNPTFTGTIAGIQYSDNITATYACGATATSNVGSYPIVPTVADPNSRLSNYTLTTNNGAMTVAPVALNVSAGSFARQYGAANPTFGGTISGLKNGDNITATYATSATASSPVTTYAIVPTLVDPNNKLGNYNVTSTNGTLTVTKAPLSAAALNASRLYGAPNPVFSGILSGVLNGDNILAVYNSTAAPADNVGTYPITPSLLDPDGKLGNYTVSLSNGTLTVTKAPLTVAAASLSRTYGSPNPPLIGTITGIQNNDNITATYTTSATAASVVGNYAIVPTLVDPGSKLGNYTVTSTNGTLTVGKAALSVTPDDASRVYGALNPAFSGTLSGVTNGDNITASYFTLATSGSAAGTYPISAALSDPGNKLPNYALTLNTGTLTILMSTPLIAWPAPARIFAGVPLSGVQLNASASDAISGAELAGTFVYTPAAGTVLAPGLGQTLSVVFTPNNAANYNTAAAQTTINVDPAIPVSITSALTGSAQKDAAFTYTITADGSAPMTFSAAGLPAGLTLVGDTISGAPTVTGVFYVLLSVSNYANYDSKSLKLTITGSATNHAPQIGSPPTVSVNPATTAVPVIISALATDEDGDALGYEWDFGDGTTGVGPSVSKTYAAVGVYIVKLTVSDGQASDTQSVNIVVRDGPATGTFTLEQVSLLFSFTKIGKDNLSISGHILLPPAFNPTGKSIRVLIGALDYSATLISNGTTGDKAFSLKGKAGESAKYTFKLKNQALFAKLSDLGFTKLTNNPALDFPVIVVLGGQSFFDHPAINYTVKSSKKGPVSGKGKK
jgi:hypothetical protein